MLQFIKDHFKFVFTIGWVTFMFLSTNQLIISQMEYLKTNEDLNFNYLVFKIECQNDDDIDHQAALKKYIEKQKKTMYERQIF